MNILIKILAISFIFLFLSLLLKNNRNEYIFFLRIGVIIIIFFLISEGLSEFVANAISIFTSLEISGLHIDNLIKVAGIAIISDFVSDVLKDNNESALSRIVELCAKLFIIVLSFPMINSLVAFCIEIIN